MLQTYTDGWRVSWTKAGLDAQWTAHEVAALIEHYPVRGPRWAGWPDVLPRRTPVAIQDRARRLGVTSRHRWTEGEVALLRRHYPEHGVKWDGWSVLLPGLDAKQHHNRDLI